jgi:hypothetical protein
MNNKFKIMELKNSDGNVYFELGYQPEFNWGLTNWIGWVQVEEVKAGGMQMLELIKKYHIKYWLNDNRELEGSWDDANEWIANFWIPNVLKAGLEKYSVIVPNNLPAQLSSEFMADNAEKTTLKMLNVQTEQEAIDWLLKK